MVVLIESIDSTVLPPIFSAPSTATMTFFTSTSLYCLYPTLVNANRALLKFDVDTNPSHALQRRGVRVAMAMDKWNLPCTKETCSTRQWDDRRIGIGRLSWREPDDNDIWERYMKQTSYEWSRGLWCHRKDHRCNFNLYL